MTITRRGRKVRAIKLVPCPVCGQSTPEHVVVSYEQMGTKKRKLKTRRNQTLSLIHI